MQSYEFGTYRCEAYKARKKNKEHSENKKREKILKLADNVCQTVKKVIMPTLINHKSYVFRRETSVVLLSTDNKCSR